METKHTSRQTGVITVTAAAVILLAIASGSRSVLGLFLSPLNSATGLGLATVSFAIAVGQLSWGVAQPFCGLLAERYGPARIIAIGSLFAAGAGSLLPFAHSASLLVAVLALGGVAATIGSPSLLLAAVSHRVAPDRRGLISGIVGAGGPFGQLLLGPAMQAVISVAGWVSATLSLAALALAALPLALCFRRRGGDYAEGRPTTGPAGTLSEALRSPQYWLINATFFVCGLHVIFLVTHLPGVIQHCGLPFSVSGLSLGVLGLLNIVGSIGAGAAIQRYSMKRTLAVLFAARCAGIALFLAAPKSAATVLAFSMWMGLTYMAVLPPTAGLIGKLFGTGRLATLLGITFVVHQAGAFLGSWLGGVVVERTGNYDRMWILDLSLAGAAAVISLTVRERERRTPDTANVAPLAAEA